MGCDDDERSRGARFVAPTSPIVAVLLSVFITRIYFRENNRFLHVQKKGLKPLSLLGNQDLLSYNNKEDLDCQAKKKNIFKFSKFIFLTPFHSLSTSTQPNWT